MFVEQSCPEMLCTTKFGVQLNILRKHEGNYLQTRKLLEFLGWCKQSALQKKSQSLLSGLDEWSWSLLAWFCWWCRFACSDSPSWQRFSKQNSTLWQIKIDCLSIACVWCFQQSPKIWESRPKLVPCSVLEQMPSKCRCATWFYKSKEPPCRVELTFQQVFECQQPWRFFKK